MSLLAVQAHAVPLDVTVTNVRNAQGEIRIAICSQARFLQPTCEHVAHGPAHPGDTTFRIDVPPGIWAAQAFHDEDNDGSIGRTILGIPTEGLGFSNDARFRFGPPRFDDAAFQLGPQGGQIRVPLRYQF